VISAVNASHNKLHQNKPSVWGCNLAGEYVGYTHPQIPAGLPTAAQWQDFEISLPRFRPPVGISASNSDVLPHIRMDSILDLMIGRK
jgi:predicted YcjX-like family ATPase